ncbi:MFS transporter [Patescibacteria group bacterium]|nr:MFS transporter [Patescibacteria group bacterium]
MNTKRNIFLWVLYDFANSLVQIVFFLYFAQWIVIDKGVGDIYFNLTFTAAAFLLLLTAPFVGGLLDKHMRRIVGVRYTTVAVIVLYGICALCAVYGLAIPALIFFALGLYAYLLTFTFYTPLITDIARPEKRGFVSGLGIAGNYAGQFVGLLLALPFSLGMWNLFEGNSRAETLLPSVVVFGVFALPMLLWFREPKKKRFSMSFRQTVRMVVTDSKQLLVAPGLGLFLLAYFLFNDAILTASNNFPIFLQQVWGLSDTTKTYVLLGIIMTSAIGGLVSGIVADRIGHKRTLLFVVSGWIVILPLLALVQNFTVFVVLTTVLGLWFGSHWTVSRSMMAQLVPSGGTNSAFAYFSLVERISSFVGPVVWGVTVGVFVEAGTVRYRMAMGVLAVFVLIGLFVLMCVKSTMQKTESLVE